MLDLCIHIFLSTCWAGKMFFLYKGLADKLHIN